MSILFNKKKNLQNSLWNMTRFFFIIHMCTHTREYVCFCVRAHTLQKVNGNF